MVPGFGGAASHPAVILLLIRVLAIPALLTRMSAVLGGLLVAIIRRMAPPYPRGVVLRILMGISLRGTTIRGWLGAISRRACLGARGCRGFLGDLLGLRCLLRILSISRAFVTLFLGARLPKCEADASFVL